MIINKPKRKGRTVEFSEILVGESFRWQNWYYIKIEVGCYPGPSAARHFNAIQLETGLAAHFIPSDLVEKIPMSIEVYE